MQKPFSKEGRWRRIDASLPWQARALPNTAAPVCDCKPASRHAPPLPSGKGLGVWVVLPRYGRVLAARKPKLKARLFGVRLSRDAERQPPA